MSRKVTIGGTPKGLVFSKAEDGVPSTTVRQAFYGLEKNLNATKAKVDFSDSSNPLTYRHPLEIQEKRLNAARAAMRPDDPLWRKVLDKLDIHPPRKFAR